MCKIPGKAVSLGMIVAVVVLLIILASCGGGEGTYTTESGKLCVPMPVPVTDMRRECHAIGNDECAYMTTEQYSYNAVGYDCK